MPRYKLTVAYDGTNYHGWQKQAANDGAEEEELPTTQGVLERAVSLFEELAEGVLGLLPSTNAAADDADPYIDLLVEVRNACKAKKDWELADSIRDRLAERGIELKDSKDGARWSRKSS